MVNETKISQTFIGLLIHRGNSSAIGKARDSTSEFGKGELLPTSSKTFFFVYVDGVCDVKFTENSVITKSKNYSYSAYRMQL